MNDHLDIDALADVLAGGHEPAHLASCPACRARLAELAAALPSVSTVLSAVPVPDLPAGLQERLSAALAREAAPAPTNVLPLARPRTRWLPALGAAAAAAVLVTGAVVLTRGSSPSTSKESAAPTYQVNNTGTNYTAKDLPAALPGLLAGTAAAPEGATAALGASPAPSPLTMTDGKRSSDTTYSAVVPADPLAALHTTDGLARCLASLTDPSEAGVPLALDYATFQGTPALVVVLPSSKPDKVDVFVVPAGCAQADGQLLYFNRLPKP